MAITLKTSGLALNCTMVAIVDTDANKVRWYSKDMTAGEDMTFAGTIASGSWRTSGTVGTFETTNSNAAAFTTKPAWSVNGAGQEISFYLAMDWVTDAYLSSNIMGVDVNNYRLWVDDSTDAAKNRLRLSGGTSIAYETANLFTTAAASFGISYAYSTGAKVYQRLAADATPVTDVTGNAAITGEQFILTPSYIGRDNAGDKYAAAKFYCVAAFNKVLSVAEFGTLHDDWKGVLFAAPSATIAPLAAYYARMRADL
jgi:hypothetical protein